MFPNSDDAESRSSRLMHAITSDFKGVPELF
jgi:hypothetical protein